MKVVEGDSSCKATIKGHFHINVADKVGGGY